VKGPVWQNVSWVIIYDAKTGFVSRVPTTGIPFAEATVAKAKEEDGDFSKNANAAASAVFKTAAEELSTMLDIKVEATDPHLILNGGTVSRGHILQQALTIGFGQLAQKELARNKVGQVARNKVIAAARAVQKEESEKEAEARREAAVAKAAAKKAEAEAAKAEAEAAKAEAEAAKVEAAKVEAAKVEAAKAAEAEVTAEAEVAKEAEAEVEEDKDAPMEEEK